MTSATYNILRSQPLQVSQQPPLPRQLLERAMAFHQIGQLADAEQLYLQILRLDAGQFEAQHLLGVLRGQQGRYQEALELIGAALRTRSDWPGALANYGLVLQKLKRHEEALASFDKALAIRSDYFEALNNRGNALSELGRHEEALASYDRALAVRPNFADTLNNRGNALTALKHHEQALASYDRALAVRPDYAEALNNRGNALEDLKRYEEALASYDRALAIRPEYAEALNNRGNVLAALERREQALASFDKALAVSPGYVEALNNRGNLLSELERYGEALASYDKALKIKPGYADALYNRGNVLSELKRHEEAVASYDQALALAPRYPAALDNRGNALLQLRRHEEAIASFDQALAVRPDYAGALNNRGTALKELKRYDEALASLDQALALAPDFADALYNRGNALKEMRRFDEALLSYDRARSIKADHVDAFGFADAVLALCDWSRAEKVIGALTTEVVQGRATVTPFTLLGCTDDPALHLACARAFIKDKVPVLPDPLWNGDVFRHDKIRIAYLSADFHEHATAYLMAELFERHDRSRFEVMGISFGRDDRSEMRQRLVAAFDQFHDVRATSDRDAARLLRELEIDIAVDLKGYTLDARSEILSFRPAPIQVNYLGFPGTMGADFIDYIVADEIVLPIDQQPFYVEKIVHLPDCYQPNDSRRKIAEHAPSRAEAGLPDGFVFACFNNNYKITAPVFDVWMRLLQKVPGSVLWLLRDSAGAENNLRAAATARGVDPARIVFARRAKLPEHLARHRLADLFLDTLPYNAHTTASDALWAGVPMVTCQGRAFAGRVAGSLLHAVGLAELVTQSLDDYEALALRLAADPSRLASLRTRLAQGRETGALFDANRMCRHIESAYTTMWETWQRGERPQSFRVEPQKNNGRFEGHLANTSRVPAP
jgi:protein O-GlcNAc transferase